jgi:hypothetical protein
MGKMLNAGFCLPAIGFAFRRGGRGYWIFKSNYLFLSSIQYPVSSIQYLRHSGINVRFQNFVFFGSGFSGLGHEH